MATAMQSTTFLSRMRSGRVPNGRPAAANAESVTAPVLASSPAILPQVSAAPSNIAMFLTNLRLLDLDLRPDWPDITARTFSTRDAGQGQKKRIQSVEWALYHLFCIWDADEARKMQQYFPPADQVQSLGLRAALLRALEQLKKSGILGRDTILRKTMLDECRGERLEEVLAIFSSVVLKKVVSDEDPPPSRTRRRDQYEYHHHHHYPAAAKTLALESRDYAAERTPLYALILAHRVSLDRGLRSKEAARAQYKEFSELLDQKQRSISRRREELKALEEKDQASEKDTKLSDDAKLDLWRAVRNNWTGSEQWMDALLSGSGSSNDDARTHTDGLLSTPYDRVWRRVQSGRLAELEGHGNRSLLEQMDKRVRLQQERLQRWQDYRRTVFGKNSAQFDDSTKKTASQSKRGIDLGFGAHKGLCPAVTSPRKVRVVQEAAVPEKGEYADLIKGLDEELAHINQTQKRSQLPLMAFLRTRTARPVESDAAEGHASKEESDEDALSDISDMEEPMENSPPPVREEDKPLNPQRPSHRVLFTKKSLTFNLAKKSHDSDDDEPEPLPAQSASQDETVDQPIHQRTSPPIWPRHTSAKAVPRPKTPPSPVRSTRPSAAKSPPAEEMAAVPDISVMHPPEDKDDGLCRSPSPTQELADHILEAMNNASPSPEKKQRHTLSLAERTRLSMAHTRPRTPEADDHDEPDFDTLPIRRNTTPASTKGKSVNLNVPDNGEGSNSTAHEDLVERTRRSMAGFEASRQKAQLERRRSQRKSRQLPRVPASPFDAVEEDDDTLVLAEELMSGEQDDAEAIFRSRPKIKMSPIPSPTRELEDY